MLFALMFVCLAASAMAQRPKPCTTPAQWEGRYTGFDSVKGDYVRARITYDALYRRERIIEERVISSDDEFYDVIYLHDQQVEYRINLKTKNCTKQVISRDWINFGIPEKAQSLGESYLGSSAVEHANLLTTIWRDVSQDSKGNKIDYFGVWTFDACLPIVARYKSEKNRFDLHFTFFDITPGIEDPRVFIPPNNCPQ